MLTPLQQRQLAEIDEGLAQFAAIPHISLYVDHLHDTFRAIMITTDVPLDDDHFKEIIDRSIEYAVAEKHDRSTRLIAALRDGYRLHGFAICNKRDAFDIEFGAFLAKARLLSWLKRTNGV